MSQYPDLRGRHEFELGRAGRIIIAALVLALAVGIAVWLRGYEETRTGADRDLGGGRFVPAGEIRDHPGWADPLAVGLVILGAGVAAAIVLVRPRRKVGPEVG